MGPRVIANESVMVPLDVEIVSTDNRAIQGIISSVQYDIEGAVFGSVGIYHLAETVAGGMVGLAIGKTGAVHGTDVGALLAGASQKVDNAGLLSGGSVGLALGGGNATGVLRNSGTIWGGEYGITIEGGYTSFKIVNTGLIASTLYGIVVASAPVDLVNSGKILRGVQFGLGNDRYDGRLGVTQGVIEGRAGNDVFLPGKGSDSINGGADTDTLDFRSTAGITVNLTDPSKNTLTAKGDVYQDVEVIQGSARGADRLTGDDFAQRLVGNGGNDRLDGGGQRDTLEGGAGNDTLIGGAGADRLIGGAGQDRLSGGAEGVQDVFVFTRASDSAAGVTRDVITDFARGTDVVDFLLFDANSRKDGFQQFAFTGTKATAHSVWYARDGGDVILKADVTGDRAADFEVRIMGTTAFSANDLILAI